MSSMRYTPVKHEVIDHIIITNRVEEWKIEKILNKRKVREVMKYSVHQKRFTVENNTWEKKEDLENIREVVNESKERMSVKVKQQKGLEKLWKVKLNPNTKKFRKSELPEKYTVKLLLKQNDRKFKDEYLKKLERNQQRQKSVFLEMKF